MIVRSEGFESIFPGNVGFKKNNPSQFMQILMFVFAFGYPLLALVYSFSGVDGFLISVIFRISYLFLSLAVFWKYFKSNHKTRDQSIGLYLLVIFFLMLFIRLSVDSIFHPNYFGGTENTNMVWFLVVVSLPCLGFSMPVSKTSGILIHLYLMLFILLLAIGWLCFGITHPILSFLDRGRFGTEYFNAISMGNMGVSLALLAAFKPTYQSRTVFVIRLMGLAVGVIIALLAMSAGPLISLIITLLIYLVLKHLNRPRIIVASFILMGLVARSAYLLMDYVERNYQIPLIARFVEKSNMGDDTRVELMRNAIQIFFDHPVFGGAAIEPIYKSYPHNFIAEAFMATGLVGGTLLLILLLIGIIKSVRLIREKNNVGWIGLIFFQYLIGSMFSGALYLGSGIEFYSLVSVLVVKWNTNLGKHVNNY